MDSIEDTDLMGHVLVFGILIIFALSVFKPTDPFSAVFSVITGFGTLAMAYYAFKNIEYTTEQVDLSNMPVLVPEGTSYWFKHEQYGEIGGYIWGKNSDDIEKNIPTWIDKVNFGIKESHDLYETVKIDIKNTGTGDAYKLECWWEFDLSSFIQKMKNGIEQLNNPKDLRLLKQDLDEELTNVETGRSGNAKYEYLAKGNNISLKIPHDLLYYVPKITANNDLLRRVFVYRHRHNMPKLELYISHKNVRGKKTTFKYIFEYSVIKQISDEIYGLKVELKDRIEVPNRN